MTTYTAKTIDLFWCESTLCDISATTEQEAIDEAFEFAETLGLVLSEIEGDDGTHISFDLPTEIPVHDVQVLIDDNGTPLETEVPSCTIDGVQALVELLWGPNALLAVKFRHKRMNFDNKRIIALNAPKSWHFPIHYLM
jgi:hypothetical protein